MKSGQSLVSAELIPYRSFTLLVVTLATMNLVIRWFGNKVKSLLHYTKCNKWKTMQDVGLFSHSKACGIHTGTPVQMD